MSRAFREAVDRAEIDLPKGRLTNTLRHSYASHFMIAGGNILTLQRIMGLADLKTTMGYATCRLNICGNRLS